MAVVILGQSVIEPVAIDIPIITPFPVGEYVEMQLASKRFRARKGGVSTFKVAYPAKSVGRWVGRKMHRATEPDVASDISSLERANPAQRCLWEVLYASKKSYWLKGRLVSK